MGYFRELPNLLYQSFLSDKNSSLDYIETKNLFRRIKLRDDLQNVFTLFTKYEIPIGYRPETVAEEYYGNEELDWVVLLTAQGPNSTSGIINVRNDWPLSDKEIYDYSYDKYGNNLNNIHHWETKEVKDKEERLILPKGQIIDEYYKTPLPTIDESTVTQSFIASSFSFDSANERVASGNIINALNTSNETYFTLREKYGFFDIDVNNLTWIYTRKSDDDFISSIIPTLSFTNGEANIYDSLSYTSTDGNLRSLVIRIKVIEETNKISFETPTEADKGGIYDSVAYVQYWDKKLNYNVIKYGNDIRTSISNYQYETELNDKKRSIYILKPEYLQQFLNDFREIMTYDKSSQFINDNTIKTENTNITMP
tara:strand:+ start:1159 stop:2262 length:1104 start_codon:yes stop_codon:yes gene_type:complete